ncbi:MAG: hypothetical protein N3G20_00400 [Verrucomicrobiae bacterium]|nr:hypothetical protein [Verrucomicrobiae bacterium]
MVQSRKTTSETVADLCDSSFYVVWVDFREPLAPPDGPRMRSRGPVAVSPDGTVPKESAIAVNPNSREALIVFIDSVNYGGYLDLLTGSTATYAVMGRFHDPATLQPISEPFIIMGNPWGTLSRCEAKYNPVSKQYVVVTTARTYGTYGTDVPMIALVNSLAVGGAESPLGKVWVHHPDSEESYDDVAVATTAKNGNFLLVAERKAAGEGESTGGCLYDKSGARLTPLLTRLDLLQSVGDEDDPDVIYHDRLDVFVCISKTDNSNGSTGVLSNRIVGSVVDPVPGPQGQLVVRVEQPLSDGLPVGRPEGHPSAIVNPFNGELVIAYDAGNDTAEGDLSFWDVGGPPDYVFAPARAEVPYLSGAAGNPFNHRHPQLAVDPEHGVILVGFNTAGSAIGLPDAYAFRLFGPDGQLLPRQLGAPYFLADSPGGLGGSVNYHNVKYSASTGSFLAVYTSSVGVTYLASLAINSSHLPPATVPELAVTVQGDNVVVSWPATAAGFALQTTPTLSPPVMAELEPDAGRAGRPVQGHRDCLRVEFVLPACSWAVAAHSESDDVWQGDLPVVRFLRWTGASFVHSMPQRERRIKPPMREGSRGGFFVT